MGVGTQAVATVDAFATQGVFRWSWRFVSNQSLDGVTLFRLGFSLGPSKQGHLLLMGSTLTVVGSHRFLFPGYPNSNILQGLRGLVARYFSLAIATKLC